MFLVHDNDLAQLLEMCHGAVSKNQIRYSDLIDIFSLEVVRFSRTGCSVKSSSKLPVEDT